MKPFASGKLLKEIMVPSIFFKLKSWMMFVLALFGFGFLPVAKFGRNNADSTNKQNATGLRRVFFMVFFTFCEN
jgi:flagellar biogenesis protein FliO